MCVRGSTRTYSVVGLPVPYSFEFLFRGTKPAPGAPQTQYANAMNKGSTQSSERTKYANAPDKTLIGTVRPFSVSPVRPDPTRPIQSPTYHASDMRICDRQNKFQPVESVMRCISVLSALSLTCLIAASGLVVVNSLSAQTPQVSAKRSPQPDTIDVARGDRVSPLKAATSAAIAAKASGAPSAGQPADSTEDLSPHSDISVVSPLKSVRPGEKFTIAVRITLDKGWHTYWTNGGDAGFPLNIQWDARSGTTVGVLQFPAPRLLPQPPLMSYGYENEVVLLAEVQLSESLQAGQRVHIAGNADWLACADVCLPAAGSVALDLPVVATAPLADIHGEALVDMASRVLPKAGDGWQMTAVARDSTYLVAIVPPAGVSLATLTEPYLFADSLGVVDHAKPQRVMRSGDTLFLELPRSPYADSAASRIAGLLAANVGSDSSSAWLLGTNIQDSSAGPLGARAAALLATGNIQLTGGANQLTAVGGDRSGLSGTDATALGLVAAAFFAFLGGLLLNLMPCVFPVLSIKVLGFVENGAGDAAAGRKRGLVFAAGVLATFWLLAGALMLLRAGGESLGWGFQLQSPIVVGLLALVIFALGLNLSGVFEIGMSLTRLGSAGGGGGYADSFLTGALAVIVATPCTAPFMGAALGFALVQPPLAGLTVFTALAVGLALPYVVFSSMPSLLRFLPKPGPWLETFKQLLAFPLYATVVWLLWVFGQQASIDSLAVLMMALTLFALGAWAWGRASVSRSKMSFALAVVTMLTAVGVAGMSASTSQPRSVKAVADNWEVYSQARVDELRAAGRPVFIDFTAAWCLSCQVNERIALGTNAVQAAFSSNDVALLKADWTSRDAEIAAVLQGYGRSGVPLYVLYPAGTGGKPELLPAVLTPGIVIDALKRAVSKVATTGGI